MLCQSCGQRPATFHHIKNENGTITEVFLCNECRQNEYNNEKISSIAGVLNSLMSSLSGQEIPQKKQQHIKCASCGTDLEDFKKTLYVGCSNCYSAFTQYITSVVNSVQNSTLHKGKKPSSTKQDYNAEYKQLEIQFKEAIKKEDFETAILLRERMQHLKDNIQ